MKEVIRFHLNYVVADTKTWEQATGYYIDNHDDVAAFVKNQGLGFAILYMDNGQLHDYIRDFIIRLQNGAYLILETKGLRRKGSGESRRGAPLGGRGECRRKLAQGATRSPVTRTTSRA